MDAWDVEQERRWADSYDDNRYIGIMNRVDEAKGLLENIKQGHTVSLDRVIDLLEDAENV